MDLVNQLVNPPFSPSVYNLPFLMFPLFRTPPRLSPPHPCLWQSGVANAAVMAQELIPLESLEGRLLFAVPKSVSRPP
jgi:hypothetical protein